MTNKPVFFVLRSPLELCKPHSILNETAKTIMRITLKKFQLYKFVSLSFQDFFSLKGVVDVYIQYVCIHYVIIKITFKVFFSYSNRSILVQTPDTHHQILNKKNKENIIGQHAADHLWLEFSVRS